MAEADATVISDFLTPMLAFNPKERVTAARSMLHPWIKDVDIEDFSTAFNWEASFSDRHVQHSSEEGPCWILPK